MSGIVLVAGMSYHTTMDHSIRSDAIMLTNFDSEEQLKDWNRVRKECGCNQAVDYGFWFEQPRHISTCERTIRDHPALIERFAGIARTAYLYYPRILLTEAQLFDGIYFMALGPNLILDILGQDNQDRPSIVVSGRQRTLEECLLRFTTDKCTAEEQGGGCFEIKTLRPLLYQVLQRSITPEQSEKYEDAIGEALRDGADEDGSVAHTVARLYAAVLDQEAPNGNRNNPGSFKFLGRRWQEWIDAERQGRIEYESQMDQTGQSKCKSADFNVCFSRISKINATRLRRWCNENDEPQDRTMEEAFMTALDRIESISKRSEAFAEIDRSSLPVQCQGSDTSMNRDRRTLKDWYQFVYRSSMADFLGCYLMAVQTEPNSYERYASESESGSSLSISGTITKLLGEMPTPRFVGFCYDSRSAIDQWRSCQPDDSAREQKKCVRNIAYCVQQAAHQFDRQHENNKIIKQFFATLIIALVAVFFDNVLLSGPLPLVVILFASWIIEVFPEILTMVDWLLDQRSASQTIVFK